MLAKGRTGERGNEEEESTNDDERGEQMKGRKGRAERDRQKTGEQLTRPGYSQQESNELVYT